MKVYIVKGDLEETDYQIDSVHSTKEKAEERIFKLENQMDKEHLESNMETYGFGGWTMDECEVDTSKVDLVSPIRTFTR